MNYYLVSFELPNSSQGGLGTYVQQCLLQAEATETHVSVICVDSHLPAGRIVDSKHGEFGRVVRFNPENEQHFKHLGKWPAVSYSCAQLILDLLTTDKTRPSFIEFCDGFGLAYYFLQRKLAGEPSVQDLPVLVTAHTPISLINQWSLQSTHRLPDYWIGEMERFCLTAADFVLSPSQYLVERLFEDWGLNRRSIEVVRNPYQALPEDSRAGRRVSPFGRRSDHTPDSKCYLAASRVQHFKGIPELIEGFRAYWAEGGASSLEIYGADTYSEVHGQSLTDFLRKRYMKYIDSGLLRLGGPIPYDELAERRHACHALIHPSLHENLPYTVIEHMAIGGIVAASTSGGHAELISPGHNGFLFNPNDPSDIARCIRALDLIEPSSASRIGEAARRTILAECDPLATWEKKVSVLSRQPSPRQGYPFIRGKARIIQKAPDEVADLLSVVIPHYNLGNLLKETVESVLSSSYRHIEIVIVDDGSTDPESLKVIDEYEQSSHSIRVIRKSNSGVADARNVGAEAAKGEFVALLDADDLVTAEYYEKCIYVLKQYPNVGYVGAWNEDFDDKGTIRWWPTFNPEPPSQFIFNTTNCQGLVLRRQAFLKYGRHDPSLRMFLDDWESTISLLANDIRGVMLPAPLFRYRIRGTSIFRTKQGLWHLNYARILKKHESLVKEYATDALLFLNQNGPNTLYHNPTYPSALHAGGTFVRRKYRSDVRQALSDLARALKGLYRRPKH